MTLPDAPQPKAPADELKALRRKLTPRQRMFLRDLPKHKNQPWATIESLGYGTATLHRWNRQPDFARVMELIEQQALDEIGLTRRKVLTELSAIAFSDPRRMFDASGALKPIHEWDAEDAASLASLEVEDLYEGRGEAREHVGTLRKVKRWDKTKALETLGKYLRMWGDDAPKPAAAEGPGLTVIVQQGGSQVGVRGTSGRVVVDLPAPE